MDPESVAKLAESWSSWNEAVAPAETPQATEASSQASDVAPESGSAGENAEPIQASTSAAADAEPPRLVQSMPVSRPMSWLRRDRDNGEGGNGGK